MAEPPGRELDPTLPAPGRETVGAPVSPSPTRIGGRYEVLGLIASGGMGSVYRARDLELGELVALKVLRRELLGSDEALARFRREVSLARRVTHRNVARTYDIGDHEGDRFLTMELVEGSSLGMLLQERGAIDVAHALDVACEIGRGLEAAHAAGVIHLDLKPDNVLLAKDGRILITDFGISRALAGSPGDASGRSSIAGTPAYMAPEQVTGDPLDEATDVYALGAILFEMLTGTAAWQASTPLATAAARLLRPPPDPRERRRDIPEDVAMTVLKCLARDRAERFATAADVRAALEQLRSSRTSAAMRAARAVDVRVRTIAVLPFTNRGDAGDEYLADGLTEELIDAFAASSHVRVRARGAVMAFKGSDRDPRDVGRILGVEAVVEGSIRRVDGALHINARLVGVADGYHLWARRIDVPETQLLRVTDEIAGAAARALDAPHDPRERGASDEAALDHFLRGRFDLNLGSPELTRSAIGHFERALVRLPNDPALLAAYAQAQYRRFAFDNDDPSSDDGYAIAERAATRALELAPTLGDARVALASLRLSVGDGVGAARHVTEALRFGAFTSPLVRDLYGRLLAEVGPLEEALEQLRAAVAIEPSLERGRADIVRAQALLGRWMSVEESLSPTYPARGVFWLLAARLSLWNPDRAWAEDVRSRILPLDFAQKEPALQLVNLRLGQADPSEVASALHMRGVARGPATRGALVWRQVLAEVALFAGRVDDAAVHVERGVTLGLFDAMWLDRCPLLAPIATDARFAPHVDLVRARAAAIRAALGVDQR